MKIKLASELKKGDKFIHAAQIYLADADYLQCKYMGDCNFGEYGLIAVKTKNWGSYITSPDIQLYQFLPVIILEDSDGY